VYLANIYGVFNGKARRACTYLGDAAIIAPRRATARAFSHQNPAYAYRFNAVPNGKLSSSHFDEVAFVFYNIDGVGYDTNPFAGMPQSYIDLADFMSKSWVSFIVNNDPNTWRNSRSGNDSQLEWTSLVFDVAWNTTTNSGNENIYVFGGNGTYAYEIDTFRAAGTRVINGGSEEIARAFQR
jgi:carboxylesterase type B